MNIKITNLSAELSDNRSLEELVCERLKISAKKIRGIKIIRQAVDARRYKGAKIKFNYIVEVETKKISLPRDKNISKVEKNFTSPLSIINSKFCVEKNPAVVGFGPAGIFAALTLAKAGLQPIIFERGEDVDSRTQSVEKFFSGGELNKNSNVQFGEGGAGTFSDGKLTTRLDDSLIDSVLKIFVEAGAPKEILFLQKPHIGTDRLREVVKNIRKKIIELGGKIFFNSQVTDFEFDFDKKISAVIVNGEEKFSCSAVFLGIGHSARDTYQLLHDRKIFLESKAFAVGVRIEHPQEFINRAQYDEDFKNPKLPAADYFLTYKDLKRRRGAYSFCMCPGGQVVAATSEVGGVVTNGMSNFARNSGIANSAILVTVNPEDFTKNFGTDALNGIRFQQNFERLAFELGGKNYSAPVQSVGDFLQGKKVTKNFLTSPTYPRGYKISNLAECLPVEVSETLKDALTFWNDKIKNFSAPDVAMTGIETRTSAPCRILRDKISRQSVSCKNLFPIGEGAGYAGGIMSSAVDGIKSAEIFLQENFVVR